MKYPRRSCMYHTCTKAGARRHTMTTYYQNPQYPRYPTGSTDHLIDQHEQSMIMQLRYVQDAHIVPPCGGLPCYPYFYQPHPYPPPHQYVDVRKSYVSEAEKNRQRRMEANRQSARRSKQRKKNAESAMAASAATLKEKNKILRDRIYELLPCARDLLEQNYKLREELGMITSTDGLYEPDMPPPVEIPVSTMCHIAKLTKARNL